MTANDNIHRLTHEGRDIILIGTAHVSQESADLVRTTIETEKPDTVCVELCESRWQSIQQKSRWREMDIVKVVKEKKAFLLLSNLILASFQRRIADKMDIRPGQEMITAIETADKVGARTWLADRDIRLPKPGKAIAATGIMGLAIAVAAIVGESERTRVRQLEPDAWVLLLTYGVCLAAIALY